MSFPPISWDELLIEIKSSISEKLNSLSENDVFLSKEDQHVVQIGVGLKYFTQYYPKISIGSRSITLNEVLENLYSFFD